MSTSRRRNELPTSIGIGFAVVFFLSLIFAIRSRQIFLWGITMLFLTLSVYVLFLFYRLVVAVEEIAAKL